MPDGVISLSFPKVIFQNFLDLSNKMRKKKCGTWNLRRSRKCESLSQMMALHLFPASLHSISNPSSSSSSSRSKQRHLLLQLSPPRLRSDRSQSGVTENDNDPSSSGKQFLLYCLILDSLCQN